MNNRIRLGIVRTQYDHWASRSGYSLLGEYLKGLDFLDIQEYVTQNSPLSPMNEDFQDQKGYSASLPWYTVFDQRTECRVQEAVSREQLDILHFLDGEHAYYYSKRFSPQKLCRLVATYHQPESIVRRGRLLGSGSQVNLLDRVVVLADCQRRIFNDYLPESRIACIPHGIDVDFYAPQEGRKGSSRPFNCLSVGFWLRDLEVIAGVASELIDRADIRFTLIGLKAGMEKGAVDPKTLKKLEDLSNVRLLDRIGDTELLAHYRNADLLFLPLLDCTANNVLLEGIACGLPVLTSDIPGARYYLDHACAEFCVPGEITSFANALMDLKQDQARRLTMSGAARNLAVSRYRWEKIAEQYKELYLSMSDPDTKDKTPPKQAERMIPARRAVCTVISSDYLHLALALFYSIREHLECDVYALVADRHYAPRLMQALTAKLPAGFHLLTREDLSCASFYLEDEDSLRWALKPTLIIHLLEQRSYDAVIFADSDVCFFENFEFLFDALKSHAILLTPHWRPIDPKANETQFQCNLQHGLYNGGFIGAGKKSIAALRWWEGACRYRCEKREADGFYVDQKYLDFLPVYFDGVKILKHKGCNVAEWNADYLPRVSLEGRAYVENWPVVFIHFTTITMCRIDRGEDEVLKPYLKKYRTLLGRADREIHENQWHLLDEEVSAADLHGSRPPIADPPQSSIWCSVVNYLELPYFLLQLESLYEISDMPPCIFVGCADYESRRFLGRLNIPDLQILSWDALKSVRLFKQRQRHEGDDDGFRNICVPFFLKHFCEHTAFGRLLYFANNLVFSASPEHWIAGFSRQQQDYQLSSRSEYQAHSGRDGFSPVFLCLQSKNRLAFLERWQSRFIRGANGNSAHLHAFQDTYAFEDLISSCKGKGKGIVYNSLLTDDGCSPSIPSEHTAICYNDAAFLIHDWSACPAEAGSLSQTRQRLTLLLEKCKRRYGLSRASDLDPVMADISKKDITRTASIYGTYIEDFGKRIREPWGGELSNTMKAYLLYMTAVEDRKNGLKERAFSLFQAVAKTKSLMPDLYRSKAHYHLGRMEAERNNPREAGWHFAECLKRTPHHSDAKKCMKAVTS